VKLSGEALKADLHIHTNFSDGSYSPEQVVEIALERGLGAIAITDHDSVGGIESARRAAQGSELVVVPGTELSSYVGEHGYHIVGLFIDPDDSTLLGHLEFFRNHRHERGAMIVDKLRKLGVNIAMDDVLEVSGSGSVGRPHIAEALVRAGAVRDFSEAFERYIGNGKPAYVPKYRIDPGRAAEVIHAAGGLAFLAHPGVSTESLAEVVDVMKMGLDGIETVHSKHTPRQVEDFRRLAETHGWLVSGGSDCHGENGGAFADIGACTIFVRKNGEKLELSG